MPLNKLVYLEERQMEDGFQKLFLHLRDSRLLHNLCIESNAIHRSFVLTGLFIYFFYAEVCMTNVTEPIWWKISKDSNPALKAVIVIL